MRKNLTVSIIISLVFLFTWNIIAFAVNCETIRNDVLRLHIIANSDSEEDQAIKLKVRDALLQSGSEIFNGTITADDAIEKITPEIQGLTGIAKKIIKDSGMNHDVRITIEKEYFDTRVYDNNLTLPAGNYMALKVIIGEGNGKNWWCVMFPALCLPAAQDKNNNTFNDVFNEYQKDIITNPDRYKIRFKVVEWFEKHRSSG